MQTVQLHAQPAFYSPNVGKQYPTQVYWGDTHLHTRNSPDAYFLGNTRMSAEDAYRFARGEEVKSQNGLPVRLRRPLDFLVVTDHAEFLGIFPLLDAGDAALLATRLGQHWHENLQAGKRDIVLNEFVRANRGEEWDYHVDAGINRSVWEQVTATADRFNEPGRFTAFSGYEWTSMPNGNNLHRNIIFKDDATKVNQVVPWSALDSTDPETLWKYLADYEAKTGGEALIIPHNPNVSNGLMFATTTISGKSLDKAYAASRARWEPLLEVTQVKGDSETHPYLSPNDEFADYETWDEANIDKSVAKEPWMLKHEYARSALKLGLELERRLGVNPFKFGMVGSTDSHTSLSTAAEDNFFGKFPKDGPRPGRMIDKVSYFFVNWRLAAAGYAVVWALENTRESLFAAMKRREVYATTGSRIVLRFFGGWYFNPDDVYRPDYVDIGYTGGVPMGGDLSYAPANRAPRFIVSAARDPDGANLDRIQIVKGWLTPAGESCEKVYDVALAGGRKVDPATGKAPPVGNTVIVTNASYSNSIGAAQLATVWIDPDFDPAVAAFYYVRVLEIPTPRWTAYDAKFFNEQVPAEIPMVQQDRAYSSPIWYTPYHATP